VLPLLFASDATQHCALAIAMNTIALLCFLLICFETWSSHLHATTKARTHPGRVAPTMRTTTELALSFAPTALGICPFAGVSKLAGIKTTMVTAT
jgi:hypothetical protein